MDPPGVNSSTGRTFGRYRVLELLGSGGMGEVHLAEDQTLGRRVALKLIRPDLLDTELARARFLREARATAALNHPNIAVLYEVGEEARRPFLAMEYVDGRSLKDEIRSELPDAGRMMRWALQIASALDHAHRRGIIHRDIKSANIALTREGAVKLLDFGLALSLGADEDTRTSMTTPGAVVGTLHYMSPETLTGQPADFRSDIYAFGVILHEMAAGRNPFEGLAGSDLMSAILLGRGAEVPPERLPAIPAGWLSLTARAMAAQPEDRFSSSAQIVEALKGLDATSRAYAEAPVEVLSAPPLILVWEFQNLSGEAAGDWLGTGLAETLTTDFGRLGSVRVVSRDQVRNFMATWGRGKSWRPEEVALRMGARWVVTGSHQRAGNRIRITPRVLEAGSGRLVATSKVDGEWDDVFALQDRVVTDLTARLGLAMDPTEKEKIARPQTAALRAYQHFSEGKRKLDSLDKSSLDEARRSFETAIQLDSSYASAHAGLGNVHAMSFIFRGDPGCLEKAVECLERALRLDQELADPYALLCYVYGRQGRIQEAVDAGRAAVELQPHYPMSHYFLGAAFWFGHEENPDAYLQRTADCMTACSSLDPAYESFWVARLCLALNSGDYENFDACAEGLREMDRRGLLRTRLPGAGLLDGVCRMRRLRLEDALDVLEEQTAGLKRTDHMYRETVLGLTQCVAGEVELRRGHADAALVHFRQAWQITREFPMAMGHRRISVRTLAGLAASYAASGSPERAVELLRDGQDLLQRVLKEPESMVLNGLAGELAHCLAVACLRAGDKGAALGLLELAAEKGWRDPHWLEVDPELAAIRREPRFRSVVETIRSAPRLQFGSLPPLPPP